LSFSFQAPERLPVGHYHERPAEGSPAGGTALGFSLVKVDGQWRIVNKTFHHD
jgi:hypothetical protein